MQRLLNFLRWAAVVFAVSVLLGTGIVLDIPSWREPMSRLLWRSATNALYSTSHTWLGFILFWVVAPIVGWLGLLIYKWRQNKRRQIASPLKAAFGESTAPLEMISLGIVVGVWLVIFVVFIGKTVYYEHRDMAGRWREVVNEKNALKELLTTRDSYITRLQTEVAAKPTVVERTKFAPEPKRC